MVKVDAQWDNQWKKLFLGIFSLDKMSQSLVSQMIFKNNFVKVTTIAETETFTKIDFT